MILTGMAIACVLINSYVRRLRAHKFKPVDASSDELPSVSVCIAARNEERALGACLSRVLASDYKKLEVLVLDDSSSDSTSLIIKAFAREGVRFVAGEPLEPGWTGKNRALDTMARAASGSIVLYMDIDTLIAPTTISQVVRNMQARELEAMWVLPQRADLPRWSALLGNMRYFWEIMTSSGKRPVSSGAFWAIQRELLVDTLGGFEPVRQYVQPEYPIASWVLDRGKYEGVLSTPALGVTYEKRWHSQIETGERTLHLVMRRSLLVSLLIVGILLAWTGSMALVVYCVVVFDSSILSDIVFVAILLMATSWYVYLRRVWAKFALLGVPLLPFTVLQELWLLAASWLRYKAGRVTWKGRPIGAQPRGRDLTIDQ